MHAIIPPDALYGTVEKQKLPSNRFAYVDQADFNDSKVRYLFTYSNPLCL